jgi:hypothetical protein
MSNCKVVNSTFKSGELQEKNCEIEKLHRETAESNCVVEE